MKVNIGDVLVLKSTGCRYFVKQITEEKVICLRNNQQGCLAIFYKWAVTDLNFVISK